MKLKQRIRTIVCRCPRRVRIVIIRAFIIITAIALIQLFEYLFHLYLVHMGSELAAGSILSRIVLALSGETETVAEVTESVEEVVG